MTEEERYALEFLLGEKIELPPANKYQGELSRGEEYALATLLGDESDVKPETKGSRRHSRRRSSGNRVTRWAGRLIKSLSNRTIVQEAAGAA